jgi:hypothetical protein
VDGICTSSGARRLGYRIDSKCTEEIDSGNVKLLPSQTRADLLVPGLHRFSWKYIQSEAEDELKTNRTTLTGLLRPGDRHYVDKHWRARGREVVYCYTRSYADLGSIASQRGESYHPIVRETTNGQFSFEDSGKALSKKILSICKDLDTHEHTSLRAYSRLGQLHRNAFLYLRCTTSNFALSKIEAEWEELKTIRRERREVESCHYELLLCWGLPCKHYLERIYDTGQSIPRSLVHPR